MTGNDFFAHFATLADAPGGVPTFRDLILQLAIRGKLAPQDSAEKPDCQILARFEEARNCPKQVRQTRNEDSQEMTPQTRPPCVTPTNWLWVPFGILSTESSVGIDRGRQHQGPEKQYGYFKMNNIKNDGGFDLADLTRVDATEDEAAIFCLHDGDFLFNTRNSRELVGKTCVYRPSWEDVLLFNNNILRAKLAGGMVPEFLDCWFRSSLGRSEMERLKSNTTNVCAIYQGKLVGFLCPLPPLPEQRRIVATVDRLMALCDELEAKQQARHAVRSRLHATLLGNLQTAANAADFARAWQRLRDHFAELFTPGEAALDAVAQLRQTILQLAVQGKLVPQDAKDLPAKSAAGDIDVSEAPDLFAVPPSWHWTRLRNASITLKYGTSVRCGYDIPGVPVLRIPNVVKGRIDIDDLKRGPLEDKEQDDLRLEKGDLLIIRSNGSTSIVGRTAVVDGAAVGMAYAGYLVRLRQKEQTWRPEFLHLAMSTNFVREQIEGPIRTTSGVKNINSTEIGRICVPLPPLAEQQRIVAKVQQLMAQCDALEASLNSAATVSERWSTAVVRRLLDGAARG